MAKPATTTTTSTTTVKPATTGASTSTTAPRSAGISAPSGVKPAGTSTTKPAATTAAGAAATTATSAAKPATGAATGASQYDFGDYTSQTLTTKAWEAHNAGDYAAVEAYAGKCIDMFDMQAVEQSQSLTDFAPKDKAFNYWALNDVATCYFILGQARLAQGRIKEAKDAFTTVIDRFPYAQCWDPKGWFWKVAQGASDKLATMGTAYDFGDYTSQTLTVKAWEALGKNDAKGVELYTKKCIELYEEEAKKQQASLTEFAMKEKAFNYWALNDVATCYFILGESLMAQTRWAEAKAAFERVVNDFTFAQCWDPKGWFWKVAVGSRGRLNKILVEGKS
jgi:tetratricopeptide (TPR) repeat protein